MKVFSFLVLLAVAAAVALASDATTGKAAETATATVATSSESERRSASQVEASVFETARSASLLEQSARKARQQARARAKAEAQLKELQAREEHFEEVMGTELKSRMDNVRRAAEWLFQQGRLEEGAAMYARCIEMYGDALAEPYKEFASLTALGKAIRARERAKLLEREQRLREERSDASSSTGAGPGGAAKARVEQVFLEFSKSCVMKKL